MGKPFRDEHSVVLLIREDTAKPLKKGGRAASEIDRYVKDLALQTADYFDLSSGLPLVMEAPCGATLGGQGVIDLGDAFSFNPWLQFGFAEHALKETPVVLVNLSLEDDQTFKSCFNGLKSIS